MDGNRYSPTSAPSDDFCPSLKLANGHSNGTKTMEDEEDRLHFDCSQHSKDLLMGMQSLQKQNQFCDAILRVGEREIQVHRAVLAASSPVLFELFQRSSTTHHNGTDLQPTASMYKLRDVTANIFPYLLDYMYTGRLNVPAQDVGEVYRSAKLLRVEQAARACAAFLADRLTPSNCLGIRKSAEDPKFRAHIDDFVQKHVEEVFSTKSFFGLPELQVEIFGAEEALENGGSESHLFNTVLDWARNNVDKAKPKPELLTEQVNLLYLNADNHLKDCKDVEDTIMSADAVITDYKKHSKRRNTVPLKQNGASQEHNGGGPLPVHIFNISPEGGVTEKEWSIIATKKNKANRYLGLGVISGTMMAISVHLRQVAPPEPESAPNSRGVSPTSKDAPERCPSLQPLNAMSTSRCACGVCVWQDRIVVCGGYDRGECLVSMEAYNTADGTWTRMPDMPCPRARFGAALLNGKMFAVGGSDGWKDLNTADCFDFETKQWKTVASLKNARSSVSAAELDGHLYVVGGSDGQKSLKSCEKYDADRDKWTHVAPMNVCRTQASACAYMGSLLVVGGTDSWNCLNTVEMYEPDTNMWTYVACLGTIRRGAGIEVIDDTVWVVGGSDGASSLRSTETYNWNCEPNTWTTGPLLNTPRANVSAVATGGNLYAIGGFSGKKFLSSMEVLALDAQEWCCYQPSTRHRKNRISAGSDITGDDQQTMTTSTNTNGSDQENSSADDESKIR